MKEHTRHRLAFDFYVRMGAHRSLEALHRALQEDPSLIGLKRPPSLSAVEAWSSAFHWQARLLDLGRQAAEKDREEQLKALREMNERHAKEGLALQQKAIERLARGEPTDRIRQEGEMVHGHVDLRSFTNEELRRLAELADRRAAGAREEESG